MITIEESGMIFGPFAEDDCWVLERSATYAGTGGGVKMVEFGWLRNPAELWLVEAKSSAPNPDSPVPETREKLAAYMADIRDKMSNALILSAASCLGRHPSAAAELPSHWRSIDLRNVRVRFILVIRGFQREWLPPIAESLNRALLATSRLWGVRGTTALVFNEALARQYGLIAPE